MPGTLRLRSWSLLPCACLLAALACGEEPRAPFVPTIVEGDDNYRCAGEAQTIEAQDEEPPEVECPAEERTLLCFGQWAAHCSPDGELVELTNCRERGLVCAGHKCDSAEDCTGCRECVPGSTACGEGGERRMCREDGSGYDVAEICAEADGQFCSLTSGRCEDLCAAAERDRSYLGCEYWAVATSNAQLELERQDADGLCLPFPFAIQIANPQGVAAEVVIESDGGVERHVRVEPSEVRTVELPCSLALKGNTDEHFSTRTREGVHRVRSNVPVTVYQFNPLEFRAELADGSRTFTHTNDASLLLPVHSLTGEYLVMAQPTLRFDADPIRDGLESFSADGPGFLAIVGAEADPVDVQIVSSAHTRPSQDGSIPALAPGDTLEVTLEPGEVLQLLSAAPEGCDAADSDTAGGVRFTYCSVSPEYDLTGTEIRAQGKVAVIAGHDCMFLPYNRWACDHLEEMILPLSAWGQEILVGLTEGADCKPPLPNLVRVLSGADDNLVRFVPEVHEPVVLARGEYLELEVREDVRVSAADAILVGQFLVGQDYEGIRSAGSQAKGDPSMSLGIPVEQWRTHYSFSAPATFPDNYINIIARQGQIVLADDRLVRGFTAIDGTDMASAALPVEGGQHHVRSQQPFGIVVYGYAAYTSYMVPGGLDLHPINGPD